MNKMIIIPAGILSIFLISRKFSKYRSCEETKSSNWQLLIEDAQRMLDEIAWYYTKKKTYNYASNLLLGSSNYDYWAVEEAHKSTDDDFKKYVQSQILVDPKQIFPAQAESVNMAREWKAAMLQKLHEDSNYIPYSTQIEWGLIKVDSAGLSTKETDIHNKITGTLGDKIQELVKLEPGLVSEYQAREYGLYNQWRTNLNAKIANDPLYLQKLFDLED